MLDEPNDGRTPGKERLFDDVLARIQKAENSTYLGDVIAVNAILRMAVQGVWKPEPIGMKLANNVLEEGKRLAVIFLGQDPNYVTIQNWNRPGAIDESLAKWCPSAETDPVLRVAHAFIHLFLAVMKIAEYADTPGVTEDMWDWQLDELFKEYALYFVGVSPQAQEAMNREPNPESCFGLNPEDCDE